VVRWTAVVLAGGRSSRFGSDKVRIRLGEHRMIDLVIAGIGEGAPVIVVGPDPGSLPASVALVREQPPFGGPVAGLAAALPLVTTPLLAVLAADMPAAAAHLVDLVHGIQAHADGLVPVDPSGRQQVLSAVYRVGPLAAAMDRLTDPTGASMRALVEQLRIDSVAWPAAWTWDVDTPLDLQSRPGLTARSDLD